MAVKSDNYVFRDVVQRTYETINDPVNFPLEKVDRVVRKFFSIIKHWYIQGIPIKIVNLAFFAPMRYAHKRDRKKKQKRNKRSLIGMKQRKKKDYVKYTYIERNYSLKCNHKKKNN